MKDKAIALLDGGIESYLLGLYGLNLPSVRIRKRVETKNAPIMGLFGAAVELMVKACLVQAYGAKVMYKDSDADSGVYKFGSECITELKQAIKGNEKSISFIWKNEDDAIEIRPLIIDYLNKFKLLQELRANGLHAGEGCSRDIAVSTANMVYEFIQLLSRGKRLKAYLKGIPAPETVIRDREAIIEDLARRVAQKGELEDKANLLRGMYIVLPYIPEMKPDWIDKFDNMTIIPPQQDDVNYLMQTLQEAHSIYLLKNRGGKEGIPVRVEKDNPDALPIAIQNIKRTLNTIPEQFNNDILTANTRLEQNRLDLPIDDFLIDLFALGIDNANILPKGKMFTAQQVWPFVVAAYNTQGTPRPCWQFIDRCDEKDKLVSFLERAKKAGNGYYKRRVNTVIKCIKAFNNGETIRLKGEKDKIFNEILGFINNGKQLNPITPQFIKSNDISRATSQVLQEYMSGEITVGDVIERILGTDNIDQSDKRIVKSLIKNCVTLDQRKGLVAVLRSEHMNQSHSLARKQMFFVDICSYGLDIQ